MKGYPNHIATKEDFLNLLAMPEHAEQAITDLKAIRDIDDAKATRATTPIDEKDPEKGYNTEQITNPLPVWKQKGFSSRAEVTNLIKKSEA